MTKRKRDELRAAGRALSAGGNRRAILADLCRTYELPQDDDDEAVAVFLHGWGDADAIEDALEGFTGSVDEDC